MIHCTDRMKVARESYVGVSTEISKQISRKTKKTVTLVFLVEDPLMESLISLQNNIRKKKVHAFKNLTSDRIGLQQNPCSGLRLWGYVQRL